jgi:hypothetical protein
LSLILSLVSLGREILGLSCVLDLDRLESALVLGLQVVVWLRLFSGRLVASVDGGGAFRGALKVGAGEDSVGVLRAVLGDVADFFATRAEG